MNRVITYVVFMLLSFIVYLDFSTQICYSSIGTAMALVSVFAMLFIFLQDSKQDMDKKSPF